MGKEESGVKGLVQDLRTVVTSMVIAKRGHWLEKKMFSTYGIGGKIRNWAGINSVHVYRCGYLISYILYMYALKKDLQVKSIVAAWLRSYEHPQASNIFTRLISVFQWSNVLKARYELLSQIKWLLKSKTKTSLVPGKNLMQDGRAKRL